MSLNSVNHLCLWSFTCLRVELNLVLNVSPGLNSLTQHTVKGSNQLSGVMSATALSGSCIDVYPSSLWGHL